MKLQLPKLNYSLLTYLFAATIGIILFLNSSTDSKYMYILFSLAFIFIFSTGCFNALRFQSYRSVLWPFILNILLILAYIISNGGTSNAAFFGSNTTPLTIFFLTLGLNAHWHVLIEYSSLSDFSFLLINALLSFVVPSLGYVIGYLYLSKMKQQNSTYSTTE